ncbi:MAG: methyltransferase domain-containing protein [Anaplasmataceae bacterium]|nr:methyltransferase domain-containing protein [Anaplasmataceae bacterium]
MLPKTPTSWNKEALWYKELLDDPESYQRQVIWPNLKRLLNITSHDQVLDVASGHGFFAFEMAKLGAAVLGIDVAPHSISLARKNTPPKLKPHLQFEVMEATKMSSIKSSSKNIITCILAIQNIDQVPQVFKEVRRIVTNSGSLHLVLTHPAFRIPQHTDWGWDDDKKIQYRRIDRYLSEAKIKIKMHPGKDTRAFTWTFHRPLQYYSKTLRNNGFLIHTLEEWTSHRKSQSGPRSKAENQAREEIPLFLYVKAIPFSSA